MNFEMPVRIPEEVIAEREQLMLTELLGETVKVRNRGYKTMRQATVDAKTHREWREVGGKRELVEDGYKASLQWKGEARAGQVRLFRRLDVMTKEGWATVWDDGYDDLSEYDRRRPAGSAKPTGLKYKSGML